MSRNPQRAARAMAHRFVELYPDEAAGRVEEMPAAETAALLERLPRHSAVSLLERLRPDHAAEVLGGAGEPVFQQLVPGLDPARAAGALARLEDEVREARLSLLPAEAAKELRELMRYPPDTAGGLMDPRVTTFRPEAVVRDALARIRKLSHKRISQVFVVDGEGRLAGAVDLQSLAVAEPKEQLSALMRPHPTAVRGTASQSEVVELLMEQKLQSLPVVDFEGRLIGIIRQERLLTATEAEASADIQTMVGVSPDERALSRVPFAVRKRLPWLHVNLLTAFLAASVVGLFESTIAQFTALAVLLPVVAGQSGNTGAQALAVTMRGLALREIRVRHWLRVSGKELLVGAINGVAVATVTALAVWVWSGSPGLAAVIGTAMVSSMVVAGLAGASIPMILTTLGQDPAQASSIILTTVTDVIGFLSFLGLATLAAGVL